MEWMPDVALQGDEGAQLVPLKPRTGEEKQDDLFQRLRTIFSGSKDNDLKHLLGSRDFVMNSDRLADAIQLRLRHIYMECEYKGMNLDSVDSLYDPLAVGHLRYVSQASARAVALATTEVPFMNQDLAGYWQDVIARYHSWKI